jgi:hypothetical protein
LLLEQQLFILLLLLMDASIIQWIAIRMQYFRKIDVALKCLPYLIIIGACALLFQEVQLIFVIGNHCWVYKRSNKAMEPR